MVFRESCGGFRGGFRVLALKIRAPLRVFRGGVQTTRASSGIAQKLSKQVSDSALHIVRDGYARGSGTAGVCSRVIWT